MPITVREKDGIVILDLRGPIVWSTSNPAHIDASELKQTINGLISAREQIKLVLNLAEVPFMDSSGLGVIVAAYTSMQRKKGRIVLLNPGKSTKAIIAMAKLMTVFEIYDDGEEALASFK